MRQMTVGLLVLLVAACSQTPTERQTAFPTAERTPAGTVVYREPRRDASGAVSVVGTPFFALFKATACVASVAIAAPAAGLIALTDRPDKAAMRRSLDQGVGHNCGGSYVLRY
jgi:hypothetical protein